MLDHNATSPDSAMADADRTFYVRLGQRLAEQRKARGITQVQLAERLGVAQQTLAHYEGGTVRIGVEALAQAAEVLETTLEELLGTQTKRAAGKRGPQPKIAQQLEQIRSLPVNKQRMVTQMIDAVLAQAER